MTDRYNAVVVILERDIREDDAEPLIEAIKQLRGVLKVVPHEASFDDDIAYARARQELMVKLWEVLKS